MGNGLQAVSQHFNAMANAVGQLPGIQQLLDNDQRITALEAGSSAAMLAAIQAGNALLLQQVTLLVNGHVHTLTQRLNGIITRLDAREALDEARHANGFKRAQHALRASHPAAALVPLEKERSGGAAPIGVAPGQPGPYVAVPFPGTVAAACELMHADLDALAQFYHEDFGQPPNVLLPARRSMFLQFIGLGARVML